MHRAFAVALPLNSFVKRNMIMLDRVHIEKPDDYFIELGKRKSKGVYFCRINGYNKQIHEFITKYHEEARLCGVIIEGRLPNPDNNQLGYYQEMLGMDFALDMNFMRSKMKKWLPRMNDTQCENVVGSIYETLMSLSRAGKNENMLKNTYIRFMCWLYYKFERIVHLLGNDKLPKILYEGSVSNYELLLLSVLSIAGCDIVLLQYDNDAEYKKSDPDSSRSDEIKLAGMTAFPDGFSLKKIREEIKEAVNQQRLFGEKSIYSNCTNAWITGDIMRDAAVKPENRVKDKNFYYNCFARIVGVDDKAAYINELFQFQLEVKNGRQVVILNNTIEPPTTVEVQRIKRSNYQTINQLIAEMLQNINFISDPELKKIVNTNFVKLMIDEHKNGDGILTKLTNKASYCICWLRRYWQQLLKNWKMADVGAFIYLGGCKTENEIFFCRMLARLPVDVLIFEPDLSRKCPFEDELLYVSNKEQSLDVTEFPEDSSMIRVGTAAYHAERELDTVMYQDSGIYRNNQYDKANAVLLQTMYEEIAILWNQELKYRPSFSTTEGIVNMPVIFSKVSGVKNGDAAEYWSGIKKMITPDTIVIKNIPNILPNAVNPVKPYATQFFRNGQLQKQFIREHGVYQYGFLRESVQEHLLDKLQLLIERQIIKGTFENGTEYAIVSTILNMDKEIVRQIQKFDFTKKNPKLIYIMTGENVLSLEDTILAAFLNLVGFDIVFFVPTGYQCIEKFFNKNMVEEHQAGDFMYDMRIPDFNSLISKTRHKWRDKIFKRGT